MCLYPRLFQNPKYKPNKKNGGVAPTVSDTRVLHVPVGCGKCIECMKQKQKQWQVRLMEDIKYNPKAKFITLTFSNESLVKLNKEIPVKKYITKHKDGIAKTIEKTIEGYERDNAIAALAVRRFLERWRKKYKKSLRHWLVTELGHTNTERLHLHGIVWQPDYIDTHWMDFMNEIENIWGYGWIWKYKMEKGQPVNYVSEKTINYITKYVSKMDKDHKGYKPIMLTSAGIGKGYIDFNTNWKLNIYNGENTNECYRTNTGHRVALPIYYRNKIYSDEEKEKLWIHKLDKNERWICGEKVDISNGMQDYYTLLNYHQKRNERLGYGNDKKVWSIEKYENERRKKLHDSMFNK